MSRHIQVTFDAHDPLALSSFWRDVLGYVHPGPPGVELPEDADPLAAWDDFLARVGVPEEQRNTRSAIEDPDGHGPRLFFQQVPEDKVAKNRVHLDVRPRATSSAWTDDEAGACLMGLTGRLSDQLTGPCHSSFLAGRDSWPAGRCPVACSI